MKSFITGISGFVGSHLAEFLQEKEYDIYGIDLFINKDNLKNILDKINILECDILDYDKFKNVILDVNPDEIYHLAGPASVRGSFLEVKESFNAIFYGTYNLLQIVHDCKLNSKILSVGSAYQYGFVSEGKIPILEDYPLKPLSPYALSKTSAELLCMQYYNNYDLKIICTRSFNHTGPRQSPHFVCPEFAERLIGIKRGKSKQNILTVGEIETKRDFLDVRDVVNAYWLLLQKGKVGDVYNVSSGKMVSIKDILNKLIELTGVDVKIKKTEFKKRKDFMPTLSGSYDKINRDTGWKPVYNIDETLKTVVDYWQNRNEKN